jgi:hypothetical protein
VSPIEVFEQFKLFSEHVQRLSERRQSAGQIYLTLNTALFGVVAFLVKDAGFRGWGLIGVSVPLFVVGIMACVIWSRTIVRFKDVIGWYYEQLRAMEATMDGSVQIYTREWKRFYEPLGDRLGGLPGSKERYGFSRLEAWLPRLLIALYAIYALGLVLATIFGWV